MIKKLFLGAATMGVVAAPVAAVVSCGTKSTDYSRIVTLQVEDTWKDKYQTIVNNFKKTYASEMQKNNIDDIKLVVNGSFKNKEFIDKNGFRDEILADVFLMASDTINNYTTKLKTWSKDSYSDWSTAHAKFMGENALLPKAKITQNIAEINSKMYGVVQNIEAMIAISKDGENPTSQITRYANLWMSAGFFNTIDSSTNAETFNLKDIVKTDDQGKIVNNLTNYETQVKAGFTRLMKSIWSLDPKLNTESAFSKVDDTSTAEIAKYFLEHADKTKILDGPWTIKNGKYADKINVTASIPVDWNQWAGGWLYTLNKRINTGEQTISEMLVAYLMNSENAVNIYEVSGKLSPLVSGKTSIETNSDISSSLKSVAKAIYDINTLEKPTDPAFGTVWDVYTNTISSAATDLVAKTKDEATMAKELYDSFSSNLTKAIEAKNK